MSTATRTIDVFLSHGLQDKDFAIDLAKRLQAEGLEPFYSTSAQLGDEGSQAIWDAIAECHAFIAIVSPGLYPEAMGLVELGAAAAWNKPIYVLLNGPSSMQVPKALQNYPVYPRNQIDEILGQIQRSLKPVSDDDRRVLAETYRDINIPADLLGQSPQFLRQLAEGFTAKTQKQLSGDRLLSELLRMRKRGALPRLSRQRRTKEL